MDYRMISITATPEDNVVDLIKKDLEEKEKFKLPNFKLNFVGFQAEAGVELFLNNAKTPMKVPSNGYFITPYDTERGINIYNLKFKENFTGDIYYII